MLSIDSQFKERKERVYASSRWAVTLEGLASSLVAKRRLISNLRKPVILCQRLLQKAFEH